MEKIKNQHQITLIMLFCRTITMKLKLIEITNCYLVI